MKPCIIFGLILSVIVTFTIAVPFQQHHLERRPGRPLPKLTVADYVEQMRQESGNRAQQDKIELSIRSRNEEGTGIREDEWYQNMNALGGRPNGIPGQRSETYGSQNNNPRPQARTGNQPTILDQLFPGQQNGGKPVLPNNWSEEENPIPLPVKPRPRPQPRPPQNSHGSRSRAQQRRNKAQPRRKIDETCGCNPVSYPECGVDGVTYTNSCFRICKAVTFKKAGNCS